MFTASQLVAHMVGDYILQSDWMANRKTERAYVAAIHAATYALPFLFFHPSLLALAVIVGTHALIDRYRLARYVCWAKNGFPRPLTNTGYPEDRPAWLSVWLLFIADNILHVLINGAALRWL
jgi:chromate transport protein ChrA